MRLRWLHRLHRDDSAQIAPLMVLGALPLAMLIALIFNTGEQIISRTSAQNAADAAAMTQGTWVARSMNVMAMNNVAITQAHAISVIGTTLMPEILAAGAEATLGQLPHYASEATRCPSKALVCGPPCLAFAAACITACQIVCFAFYAALALHIAWIDAQLIELGLEAGRGIGFGNIAKSLSEMNEHIVANATDFNRNVQRQIAETNNLTDPDRNLIMFAGYAQSDPYTLPVAPTQFVGAELCKTGGALAIPEGARGTFFGILPGSGGIVSVFDKNFEEHGYEQGTGPFEVGRDTAITAIAKPVDALESFPHVIVPGMISTAGDLDDVGFPDSAKFENVADEAYLAACLAQFMLPGGRITVYEVANPRSPLDYGNRDSRDRWSLLAYTRKPRETTAVMGGAEALFGFDNPPHAVFGMAQAEVYNGLLFDLYTQGWRAKLVPAHMLEGDLQNEAIAASEDFDALHGLLDESRNRLEVINAH